MNHLPKIKFVWKTCKLVLYLSFSLCPSAMTPCKSQRQLSSWSTKKERHFPMLPSNLWNYSQCRLQQIRTLAKARVSIRSEDLTANTPAKKSKRQSSRYSSCDIDPKRLRCQCRFQTLRYSQEELITLEEIWVWEERRRRETYRLRNGTDCVPQNQIRRANWRKANKIIGCFSQQNRFFQGFKGLVRQVLPTFRHQIA